MPIEPAQYVDDLVPAYPQGVEPQSGGDDHIRLLKQTLQNTFPNAGKPFYFPNAVGIATNTAVNANQENATFIVDTASGDVTMTMPTLTAGQAGWSIGIIKQAAANKVVLAAPNGLVNGGSSVDITTQYNLVTVTWTGTTYIRDVGPALAEATDVNYWKLDPGFSLGTTGLKAAGRLVPLGNQSGNVAIDFRAGLNFSLTAVGNINFVNPPHTIDEVGGGVRSGLIWVQQDGSGNKAINFTGNWWRRENGVLPPAAQGANQVTVYSYTLFFNQWIGVAMMYRNLG